MNTLKKALMVSLLLTPLVGLAEEQFGIAGQQEFGQQESGRPGQYHPQGQQGQQHRPGRSGQHPNKQHGKHSKRPGQHPQYTGHQSGLDRAGGF